MKHDLKIILAIIGIVVALVMFFQIKACIVGRNDANISRLEGELEVADAAASKIKTENQSAINEMRAEISKQEAEIKAKNKTILELQKQDEEIVPTEIIDTPGVDQNWEVIAGRNAEAARDWKKKYFKAQEVIKELGLPIEIGRDPNGQMLYKYPHDSVTYKLNARYLLAADQRDKALESLALTENLNRIQKSVIVEKDKKIGRLKLGKTVTSIITYPLAIYGGYKLGQAIFGL